MISATIKDTGCGVLQSINALHKLTGFDRDTVLRRLKDLHFELNGDGPTAAKQFESTVALPILYGIDPENPGEKVTAQEAARRLTLARERQVIVQTEVTSGERIHRDDVQEVFDEFTGDIAAIVKNKADALGKEAVADVLTKLREAAKKLCLTPSETLSPAP